MDFTFTGFSEEDLCQIKSGYKSKGPEETVNSCVNKISIGGKLKKNLSTYRSHNGVLSIGDAPNDINKLDYRLSIKNDSNEKYEESPKGNTFLETNKNLNENITICTNTSAPDIVNGVNNSQQNEVTKESLEDLTMKQKIIEEQNRKRKEMLSKAIADRTKQTEEEVLKLEKIKKELEVLDGQLSQEVAVLRRNIDLACINYTEAEKHYLRIEKEFLQAKINLQKQKEKKKLLTEHLTTLITHNETRKAKKLESLMLELADKSNNNEGNVSYHDGNIMYGVDEKTGKFVEFTK